MTRSKVIDGDAAIEVTADFAQAAAIDEPAVADTDELPELLVESDPEGVALELVREAATGDERWLALLPRIGRLVGSHEWSSNEAEYDFVSQLAGALDVTDSWTQIGSAQHFHLLVRQLELEVACDIEPDFSAHLGRHGLDECNADAIAEALVQALTARRGSLWGHGENIKIARDSLYRFAGRVGTLSLRGRLLLEIAAIELADLDQPDAAARTLMLAFGGRWQLFEDAVRMLSGYPDFIARLYGSVLARETNALVRLQIRQAMANVNADFLRAELIPSPTVALYHVDVATDPRFPTSALFYADSPLVERNRDGGPASSGAPALASPTTFPADADLEYRFWIDERPDQGIADANQMGVRPPTGTQFPVCLTVDVWSDNLDFSIRSAHITLNQTGNSDTASFRFRLKDVGADLILTRSAPGIHGEVGC